MGVTCGLLPAASPSGLAAGAAPRAGAPSAAGAGGPPPRRPAAGCVRRSVQAGASRATFAAVISVSGEYRWPDRLWLYIGQSPDTSGARDCPVSATAVTTPNATRKN